jgi:hypothetical protein
VRKLVRLLALGTLTAANSLPVAATSTIQFTPSNSNPGSAQTITVPSGTVTVNKPINFANGSALVVGLADDARGLVRQQLTLDLMPVVTSNDAQVIQTAASFNGSARLVGLGTSPQPITFVFAFDGYFGAQSNMNQLLVGSLTVSYQDNSPGVLSTSFVSQVRYQRLAGASVVAFPRGDRTTSFADGSSSTVPYAGAQPSILSSSDLPSLNALKATAMATFLIEPGKSFGIGASLQSFLALANPASAGFGSVNALDTGTIGILIPVGYSLTGTNGFLATASVTQVPEPPSLLLLLSGLALFVQAVKRKIPVYEQAKDEPAIVVVAA